MTLTRAYYEALINIFSTLTKIQNHEVPRYLKVKQELQHLITRIQNFNLLELTFSDDTVKSLSSERLSDFTAEKLALVNELHYELYTCLHTKRLRYGGELMQYMLKLKLILLQLPAAEIVRLNSEIKIPQDYYLPHDPNVVNEEQKLTELKKLSEQLKQWPVKRDTTKVKKSYYAAVASSLKQVIGRYQDYIFANYPEIANEFSFFQRKVRGYVTQAMSAKEYEFRLYAYEPTDGDRSVHVVPEYYDFCPSYFYNLEEITDRQVSAMVMGLQKDTFTLSGLFDITFIHRELLEIFLRISNEYEIAKFIEFLLKCDQYYIQAEPIADGYRFDLQGRLDAQWKFFEFFHRHPRSTKVVTEKIQRMKATQPNGQLAFIFTSRPEEEVFKLLEQNNVEAILLHDLFNRHFIQKNSQLIHWYIRSVLPGIERTDAQLGITFEGEQLIKRLKACVPGEQEWAAFEQIGAQVFQFLFADNFRTYLAEIQSENNLKNHRRDLIVNNNYRTAGSFWAEVKDQFNCAAIIVDFKNYTGPLNANTLFNASKYTVKGVGNFAIIFCRKGLDETAVKEQQTLFRQGKLLIEFSDTELVEMIQEKMIGKDPIDRLDSKKFQLVKRI